MKAFRKVVLLTVVLCLYGFFSCLPAKSFDTNETFTITVIGGYATCDGEVVTEARYGDSISIFPDIKAGEYVKEWKKNFETSGRYGWYCCFNDAGVMTVSFDMPYQDIVITAVTEQQKPYTIDLTKGSQSLPHSENWYNNDYCVSKQWICQSALGYSNNIDEIDLDHNGTNDIKFCVTGGHIYPTSYELVPLYGCSIYGDYVCDKTNAGPYWPITIKFGDNPIRKEYNVTIKGGTGYVNEADGRKTSFSAASGSHLIIGADNQVGSYVTGWTINGVAYHSQYLNIIMPAIDIEVSPIRKEQTPLLIDLSKGYASLPRESFIYSLTDINHNGTNEFQIDYSTIDDSEALLIPLCELEEAEFSPEYDRYCSYYPITVKLGRVKKYYSIQVSGGHAEDENGNAITQAKSGQTVRIIRDSEPGKYWKAWKSNYPVDCRMASFSFIMPATDVTFTAETTSSQVSYSLDLTESYIDLSEEELYAIGNAVRIFNKCSNPSCSPLEYVDFDGNGTEDIGLGKCYPDKGIGIHRFSNYNLGTEFTVSIEDGQIGSLTLIVNNEKSDKPVKDTSTGPFTVTLNGRVMFAEKSDWKRKKEFYPGELVEISGDSIKTAIHCDDIDSADHPYVLRFDGFLFSFYMPYHDVTITELNSKQTPLELDLRSGSCEIELTEDFDFHVYFIQITDANWDSIGGTAYKYDIDHDGVYDLSYNVKENKLVILSSPYILSHNRLEFNTSDLSVKYNSLTLLLSDNTLFNINYKLYTNDNQEVLVTKSPYPITETEDHVKNVLAATPGTVLTVSFYKTKGSYELEEYYYWTTDGRFYFTPEEIPGFSFDQIDETDELISIHGLVMPEEEVNFVGIYKRKPDATATPMPTRTVTPTPTPTVAPTANVSPTMVPSEAPGNTDKPKTDSNSDSVHPFTLLIAGLVLCMIGVAVYAVFYIKKSKSSKED